MMIGSAKRDSSNAELLNQTRFLLGLQSCWRLVGDSYTGVPDLYLQVG